MSVQITHVSVHQTSKVVALMYFFFMLLFIPVGVVFLMFVPPDPEFPQQRVVLGVFFLFAPVIYAVLGYLGFALAALVYNGLARRVGGFEFDTADQLRGGAVRGA